MESDFGLRNNAGTIVCVCGELKMSAGEKDEVMSGMWRDYDAPSRLDKTLSCFATGSLTIADVPSVAIER